MTTALSLEKASCFLGGRLVLQGLSFALGQGDVVAVLGASGAGKSNLLSLLDGRLPVVDGAVEVGGICLSSSVARKARRKTGFIFQDFALVDRLSVFRNVMAGRLGHLPLWSSCFGRDRPGDRRRVMELLDETGLAPFADRRVDALSGGQRQRVAVARCLAQEPDVILADEPVSNLDPESSVQMLELLTAQARTRGATVVFSTHQPDLALRFADRLIGLVDGQIRLDSPTARVRDADIATLYGASFSPYQQPPQRQQPCLRVC